MKIESKEVVTKEYVLTLTEEEAIVLKSLVGNLLGSGSVRTFCDRIYNDLPVKNVCDIFETGTIRKVNYL